jgi:hypothetical protein
MNYWEKSTLTGGGSGSYHVTKKGKPIIVTPLWSHLDKLVVDRDTAIELVPQDAQYFVQAAADAIYSQNFDALTFVAELKSFRVRFRLLFNRFLLILKRLDLDSLANVWLEARYQWRTLLYDMQDLHNALVEFDSEKSRFVKTTGTTSHTVDEVRTQFFGSDFDFTEIITTNITYGVGGIVAADILPPRFQISPITTAYELVRLSHVVDWFVNIGQALGALHFLLLSEEHTAAKRYKVTVQKNLTITDVSPKPGITINSVYQNWHSEFNLWLRIPTTVTAIPHLKVRLDAFKIADLLALLYQILKWR